MAEPVTLDYPFGALRPGEPVAIAEGVSLLPIPVPFPPGAVNAVALEDGDGWTLLDTGLLNDDTIAFWGRMREGPLQGRPIRRVIASHHHPDHIGLAGWFQRAFGAELWTSRTAWLYARMLQLDAWTEPPPESEAFMRACGFDDAMMARYRERAVRNFSTTVAPLPLGVRTIDEGADIVIGERRWRVHFGHGHAPDHLVLVSLDDDLVLAADQILPKITPNIGLYPTEPLADPLGDWIEACERLAAALDDDRLILPGHGDPFRGAQRRLQDVVGKHRRALERLEAHLSEPRTTVDCFPALYRRAITPALEGLANAETASHLNRLEHAGRARRERDANGVDYWMRAE